MSEDMVLFTHGMTNVTYGDMLRTLREIGAGETDILFVHSELSFGVINKDIGREKLKELLVEILCELGVKTLIFPTFTFSFCNEQVYDIEKSKTAMGMLPEYIRKRADSIRTDDPMLSVTILGESCGLDEMTGESSCGEGGIFGALKRSGKRVKFLFLGTTVNMCFTYLHYIEEVKKVPYRYLREFCGKIIKDGNEYDSRVLLNVRYKDVIATLPCGFEGELINRGILKKACVGASSVSCVDEAGAYKYIEGLIDQNPYVFSILPESGELVKEYSYGNVTTM